MKGRLLCAILVLGLASCSKETSNVELQPVSGTATLDGKAVSGISVSFVPGSATKGHGAFGTTDESGKFVLKYRDGREGIPTGKYRVLFSRLVTPDGSPIPEGEMAADVGAVNKLPQFYNDTDQSPFVADVPEGGKTFDFKLNSRARPVE